MTNSAYGTPLIADTDGKAQVLERVSLVSSDTQYGEKYLQDLVFDNPSCLPVDEIDQSFTNLIPVCCELNTPAGPLDVLFVTPTGRLCIVEAKLWRNPEARRKVIAQILDYAKELCAWSYEDLQREVTRVTGIKGNALFELTKRREPDLDEKAFCDAVSQSLTAGRFLLLIVGDGIREGVGAITEFIERSGNLEFTFGLVELALHRHHSLGVLVQPRVLAKTMVIRRTLVRVFDDRIEIDEDTATQEGIVDSTELNDSQKTLPPDMVLASSTTFTRRCITTSREPNEDSELLSLNATLRQPSLGICLLCKQPTLCGSLLEIYTWQLWRYCISAVIRGTGKHRSRAWHTD